LVDEAAQRQEKAVAMVTSAVALSTEQHDRLAAALQRIYHRAVVLHVEVDPSLVGGMVVRVGDEVIDGSMSGRIDDLRSKLATAHHTRLVVCENGLDNVVGGLHVRKVLNAMRRDEIDLGMIRSVVREPYFVPEGTKLLDQLTNFQENQRHVGLVVDEYGEILGLVTLKDILEEIVGEFTSQAIGSAAKFHKEPDGSVIADGSCSLRVLNRKAGFDFPLEGPKTINGLLLESLEDIPEAGTTLNVDEHPVEILQVQNRMVKVVRILPHARTPEESKEAA
jgi:Mg2+/Co2+ transporter CorB